MVHGPGAPSASWQRGYWPPSYYGSGWYGYRPAYGGGYYGYRPGYWGGYYGYRPGYWSGYYGYYGPGVGVYFGSPWYWTTPWFGYAYPSSYTYPYWGYAPSVSYGAAGAVPYVEAPAAAAATEGGAWYYCVDPPGYFPYIQRCNRPWVVVQPSDVSVDAPKAP